MKSIICPRFRAFKSNFFKTLITVIRNEIRLFLEGSKARKWPLFAFESGFHFLLDECPNVDVFIFTVILEMAIIVDEILAKNHF